MAKAAVALTRNACPHLAGLLRHVDDLDLFVSQRHGLPELMAELLCNERHLLPRIHSMPTLKEQVPMLFRQYEGLIFFASAGLVVRLLAPHIRDKKRDPAVVVVDDAGRYAVSLLSGHWGGGNRLARQVAAALGGEAVITTASERYASVSFDQLGRMYGWDLAAGDQMTAVMAALVNGEKVGLVQESGERIGRETWSGLEAGQIRLYSRVEEALQNGREEKAWVVITHRVPQPFWQPLTRQGIVYTPRSLTLGIGCSRGASAEEIEQLIDGTLQGQGFSPRSVRSLASISLKRDEAGLLRVAQRRGWPLLFYDAEELNLVRVANPSEAVYRATGSYSVCEAAALLSSGGSLLVPKVKTARVTLAIGQVAYGGNSAD